MLACLLSSSADTADRYGVDISEVMIASADWLSVFTVMAKYLCDVNVYVH